MATTEPVGTLIPSLPDDVALDCLARVPRSHHATLSHVSRAIRTAVSSPPFIAARCRLRCTEPVLYIFLRSSLSPSFIFSLDLHSDSQSNHPRTLTPVPAVPEAAVGSAYAAVGPTIYVLGGSINDISTARVWALDCRFNRWRHAPSMRVGREFAAAGVVDGKIYVMGGCVVDTWFRSNNWAEVFDTLTGAWKPVASPVEVREKWMHASAMINGKIYAMADRGGAVYDARSGAWESVESNLDMGWRGRACVVDGILYCYDYLGKIRGYNVEEKAWRELRGVERGLPRFLCGATMANVGEKLVVVWEEKGSGMEIWCAEIRVEKRDGGRELWGQVAWAGKVGCVPSGSCIVQCLAVEG